MVARVLDVVAQERHVARTLKTIKKFKIKGKEDVTAQELDVVPSTIY